MRFGRTVALVAVGAIIGCSSAKDAGSAAETTPPPVTPAPAPAPAPTPVQPAAVTTPAAPVKMVKVNIENGSVNSIAALKWLEYSIAVPSATCTVSGHIEALAGGNKDFDAFILDDDNFKVWTNNLEPKGTSSGRSQKWDFSQAITGPGKWHLVISNRFSELSKKVVKVWFSRSCPDGAA